MKKDKAKKAPKSREAKAGSLREVSVAELADAMASEPPPLLIDVRTAFEHTGGHVPGAKNVPLQGIDGAEIEAAGEVWVICKSGSRSRAAADSLVARGYRVVNVRGGTDAWASSGRPLDPPASPRRLLLPLLFSLTLGLAPFTPEPHLLGKLRWVLGGARGMSGEDWFDLVLHGAPWLWLIWRAIGLLRDRAKAKKAA